MNFPEIEFLPEVDLVIAETAVYTLVVFNDDFNTFDHVIETLCRVCGHSVEQADQCAHIIHFKGKCSVKTGEWEKMASMCTQICEAGLSAEVVS